MTEVGTLNAARLWAHGNLDDARGEVRATAANIGRIGDLLVPVLADDYVALSRAQARKAIWSQVVEALGGRYLTDAGTMGVLLIQAAVLDQEPVARQPTDGFGLMVAAVGAVGDEERLHVVRELRAYVGRNTKAAV
jgi:hypothetical protein